MEGKKRKEELEREGKIPYLVGDKLRRGKENPEIGRIKNNFPWEPLFFFPSNLGENVKVES